MHLSTRAQQLLNDGNLVELQALGYEELLPEDVRKEILNSFLRPRESVLPGDSVAEIFLDPTSYSTLSEACVLSSGHIFSRTEAEAYLQANRGRSVVTCPMSRQPLQLNIAGTRLAYVRLPKIDSMIQGFRRLRANPPSSGALLKSFDPDRKRAPAKDDGAHSAMAAVQYTPAPAKAESAGRTGHTVEVKVANNKIRLVIVADSPSSRRTVENYLETALPGSKVDHRYASYSMDTEKFGRCWKTAKGNALHVDLWFPPAKEGVNAKTFTDRHLASLLTKLSRKLNLPVTEAKAEAVPTCSIKDIEPREYIVAMEATHASVEQMIDCCQVFLDTTENVSNRLGIAIDDTVKGSEMSARSSRTNGLGFFPGARDGAGSTSSSLNLTRNGTK